MTWLDDLKAGDKVIVSGSTGYNDHVSKVTGRTKLHLLVGDSKTKYRMSGHSVHGGTWNGTFLREYTEENLAPLRLAADRSLIRNTRPDNMSDEDVRELAAFIRAMRKEKSQ